MTNFNHDSPPGTVVITGASSGIGEACALHLDRLGFRVFAGVRKEEDGVKLSQKAVGRLIPLSIDVTDEASIEAAAALVTKATGDMGLVGLVNNAGISVASPVEFLPMDQLRRQFEVNVFGQIAVTQAFLPLLRKGQGHIVNIGSIGGKMATPFLGAYNASKFAMEAFTDSLRMELDRWEIPVSIIEPGSVATPIWDKSLDLAQGILEGYSNEAHELYDEAIEKVEAAAKKTEQRGVPPQAVADAVTHALTTNPPKTRYVVGQDAQIQAAIAKTVPDRLRDRLIMQQMNLPTSQPLDLTIDRRVGLLAGLAFGVILVGLLMGRRR